MYHVSYVPLLLARYVLMMSALSTLDCQYVHQLQPIHPPTPVLVRLLYLQNIPQTKVQQGKSAFDFNKFVTSEMTGIAIGMCNTYQYQYQYIINCCRVKIFYQLISCILSCPTLIGQKTEILQSLIIIHFLKSGSMKIFCFVSFQSIEITQVNVCNSKFTKIVDNEKK